MSAFRFDWRGRHEAVVVRLAAYAVAAHGALIIAGTLHDQLFVRGGLRLRLYFRPSGGFGLAVAAQLLVGLGLLYVSMYLARRKRTAWLLAVGLYTLLLTVGLLRLFETLLRDQRLPSLLPIVRNLALPALLVLALLVYRRVYTVKSDVRSFALSLRTIGVVLFAAFCYGVVGFLLLDKRDFHQEISLPGAIQHTIDQFGLTTAHQLVPFTRRARVFTGSLSVISVGAVAYALAALFQPLRARLSDQTGNRELADHLLRQYPASSEDFFKLWPHDKTYFFNPARTAGLAYAVHRGVALAVGDPFGNPSDHAALLAGFDELCRTNDWAVAFVHTEPAYNELYKLSGFTLQKIGEEAVLALPTFLDETFKNKYFRQIRNKFEKQGFTTELFMPPHDAALLSRLRVVSNDWLHQPGRSERRFMMGYFSTAYMQQCPLMVLRDSTGTIQAFINQIPSFDPNEANFDMLRHTHAAPGNSNDFLLMAFIRHVHAQGFERLNLGLCPLAGLAAGASDERTIVDGLLHFVYANGDRFYSFSGLHRFKAKYHPEWHGRYVACRGGIRGFTRAMNALNRAMHVR